jgi:hypothetical protein
MMGGSDDELRLFVYQAMIYYQHSVYMFVGGAASAGANGCLPPGKYPVCIVFVVQPGLSGLEVLAQLFRPVRSVALSHQSNMHV